jgi:hypothetical protein
MMASWSVVESVKSWHTPRGHRIAIGLALAVFGLSSVFYQPAFTLVVGLIAVGLLWEFAELSARKGTTLDYPVALAAVIAYLLLTYLGLIHRWEGVLLGATVIVALARVTLSSRG